MEIELGMNYNSKCALAIEQSEHQYDVVNIEAHGLEYQSMSRSNFLREYYRDILEEQWIVLCKFLKVAMMKDGNNPVAVQILMKGLEMKLKELKDKSMAELVEMYNPLAKAAGKKELTKFKTLEAGRLEIVKLANAKPKTASGESKGTGTGRARLGIGVFAKDLLRAGKSVADTFEAVRKKFPTGQTTKACISYYKNALVKAGDLKSGRTEKTAKEKKKVKKVKAAKTVKPSAPAQEPAQDPIQQ
jgi:hypothetical protein